LTPFFKERKSALENMDKVEVVDSSNPISTPFDANAEHDDWYDPRSTHEINI